jgi:predicted dehydrogenase
MKRVRWGILSTAKIGLAKVIPAMQRSPDCEIRAIASRDGAKARQAAQQLNIPIAHASYEALLADPEIDAIYNPLPNEQHVPWSIRAAAAGKHVLCEKPIGLSAAEAEELIRARDLYGVKIGEAFMARTHPQWMRALDVVQSGAIGTLRLFECWFFYNNTDPKNIRNQVQHGGGALMDIGCYPITLSRMLFAREPERALGWVENDPAFGTDRLSSAMLDYGNGRCVFTCSTQLAPAQRVHLFGDKGSFEIEIPFNAPPDAPCIVRLNGIREELPVCDQYTIQGDLFSQAILHDRPVPVSLEDARANMRVIEAIFRSAESGIWERP